MSTERVDKGRVLSIIGSSGSANLTATVLHPNGLEPIPAARIASTASDMPAIPAAQPLPAAERCSIVFQQWERSPTGRAGKRHVLCATRVLSGKARRNRGTMALAHHVWSRRQTLPQRLSTAAATAAHSDRPGVAMSRTTCWQCLTALDPQLVRLRCWTPAHACSPEDALRLWSWSPGSAT